MGRAASAVSEHRTALAALQQWKGVAQLAEMQNQAVRAREDMHWALMCRALLRAWCGEAVRAQWRSTRTATQTRRQRVLGDAMADWLGWVRQVDERRGAFSSILVRFYSRLASHILQVNPSCHAQACSHLCRAVSGTDADHAAAAGARHGLGLRRRGRRWPPRLNRCGTATPWRGKVR